MTLAAQTVTLDGAKAVAVREALVTHAYPDGLYKWGPLKGQSKWSIGFGSQTPVPKEGEIISKAEAFKRLRNDIKSRELILNKKLKVVLSQPAFDALFSLYYQSGNESVDAVVAIWNSGTPEVFGVAEFINWNFGENRIPTIGHTRRRIGEMHTAITGDYGNLSMVQVFAGNPREVHSTWEPFPEVI